MCVENKLSGKLYKNHDLAQYTTWHVGGPAKIFYQPYDLEDLSQFLKSIPFDKKILWLGGGSNVLISDEGFDGVVIYTKGSLTNIEVIDSFSVRVEAGATCSSLANFCAKNSLLGAAFLAGIPGTIGGALAMNAGAFDDEAWDNVVSVEVINRQGEIIIRTPEQYDIGYRHVVGPVDEWFVAANFVFEKGDTAETYARIRELMAKRAKSQPLDAWSCGSVFRNPEGDYAARLIEASGLKGKTIGGAAVSEKHANFIINAGNATAKNIKDLIEYVQNEVEKQQRVELQLEVRIV